MYSLSSAPIPHWSEKTTFQHQQRNGGVQMESTYRHHVRASITRGMRTPANYAMNAPASYSGSQHLLHDGGQLQQVYDMSPSAIDRMQYEQERRQLGSDPSPEQQLSSAFHSTRLFSERAPHEYFLLNNKDLNNTPRRQQQQQQSTGQRFSPDNPYAQELERMKIQQRVMDEQRAEAVSLSAAYARQQQAAAQQQQQQQNPHSSNNSSFSSSSVDAAVVAAAGRTSAAAAAAASFGNSSNTGDDDGVGKRLIDFKERNDAFVSSKHNASFFNSIGSARLATAPRPLSTEQAIISAYNLAFKLLCGKCEQLAIEYHQMKEVELAMSHQALRQLNFNSPKRIHRAN